MNREVVIDAIEDLKGVDPHNIRFLVRLVCKIYDDFVIKLSSRKCDNCRHFKLLDMNGQPDEEYGFGWCDEKVKDASKGFGCNRWKAKN